MLTDDWMLYMHNSWALEYAQQVMIVLLAILFSVAIVKTWLKWKSDCAKCAKLDETIAMLRGGDTCARHCEGTAYRIEARRLKSRVAELEDLLSSDEPGGRRGTNAQFVALREKAAAQSRLIDQCVAAIELLAERTDVPDANCSCHLSPPCNDCIEFGGIREALQDGQSALKAVADHKKGCAV